MSRGWEETALNAGTEVGKGRAGGGRGAVSAAGSGRGVVALVAAKGR